MENPFAKIPNLTSEALEKLHIYSNLLREKNAMVNLLSRKDMDDVEYRHVAFCASINAFFTPSKGAKIADVGTGGGLPGIVLAILYPQAKIVMFDGVGKKINMINQMLDVLNLPNAKALHSRVEEQKDVFDYAVGRSVCALPMFFGFVKRRLARGKKGILANGVIYFKGGEIEEELLRKGISPSSELDLRAFFEDVRFEGKRIVHFPTESVSRL